MSKRKTQALPPSLAKARRRFDRWRKRNRPRARLPEDLWSAAVELGLEYGVNPTAKALRLDYYSLKKRLEAFEGRDDPASPFIEILPGMGSAASADCTMEIEDGNGAALRIRVQGVDLPDLAAIARAFRGGEP